MKQSNVKIEEIQETKMRKVRSDKGQGRTPYKMKNEPKPEERAKRSYVFRNRIDEKPKETILKRFSFSKKGNDAPLTKYERALLGVIKENEPLIQAMGDGSLPFVIGAVVSKYGLSFVTELGLIRTKLIKKALNHLQELNILKVQTQSKNYLGAGTLQLI